MSASRGDGKERGNYHIAFWCSIGTMERKWKVRPDRILCEAELRGGFTQLPFEVSRSGPLRGFQKLLRCHGLVR